MWDSNDPGREVEQLLPLLSKGEKGSLMDQKEDRGTECVCIFLTRREKSVSPSLSPWSGRVCFKEERRKKKHPFLLQLRLVFALSPLGVFSLIAQLVKNLPAVQETPV